MARSTTNTRSDRASSTRCGLAIETLLVELSRANAWTGELDQPVIVGWENVQNVYLDRPDPATLKGDALKRYHAWTPFHRRIKAIVMPNLKRLIGRFRDGGLDVLFARIAFTASTGIFTDQCISSTVRSLADEAST